MGNLGTGLILLPLRFASTQVAGLPACHCGNEFAGHVHDGAIDSSLGDENDVDPFRLDRPGDD